MDSKHQLINTWLSSKELLTPEQQEMVQAHMRTCETCRQQESAWEQVALIFRSAGQISPMLGFSSRFQQRLALTRANEQRRKSWLFFWIIGSVSLVTLSLLVFQLWQVVRSPAQFLVALVYLANSILAVSTSLGEYLRIFSLVVPSISLIGLMFFVGFISLLSVLWVVMFQKLSSMRRVV